LTTVAVEVTVLVSVRVDVRVDVGVGVGVTCGRVSRNTTAPVPLVITSEMHRSLTWV
jgi:hypothetical protein